VFPYLINAVGNFCRASFGFSILFIGEKTFSFIFFLFFGKKRSSNRKKMPMRSFLGVVAERAQGIGGWSRYWGFTLITRQFLAAGIIL
jgi:hypothetical protein